MTDEHEPDSAPERPDEAAPEPLEETAAPGADTSAPAAGASVPSAAARTSTPIVGADAGAVASADLRPREARLRDAGQALILRLLAVLRVGRSYRHENQVFRTQLSFFVDTLRPVIAEFDEAVLVTLESDVYLNGVRIPMTRTSLKHHQAAAKEFQRRRIAGVRAERGVTQEEVETFFSLFLQPDEYYAEGLLEAALAASCDHFQPVVHASVQTPRSSGGGTEFFAEPPDLWSQAGRLGGESFSGGAEATSEAAALGAPGSAPRGTAPKHFHLAVSGARSLLTSTSITEGMQMRHAKRVVQPLIDGAFSDEPVVMGLSTLGHHDEFTYMHAVNTCLVAVTMGHLLGLDRRALADLGVAALLHDVGKNALGDKVMHAYTERTAEEHALAETHAVEGAKLVARSTTLNETTLRVLRAALEHHAGEGGYPTLRELRPSVISRIVSCADCYASLQTHRSERGQMVTPYEALGMMLGPLSKRFDRALLWALTRTLGFYPPGQAVELDDGTIALVLGPNPADLARPHLRVVTDALGQWVPPDEAIEFRPLPSEREVKRALPVEEYPQTPNSQSAA
jgi:HD-GYP domain-containing protein (c-di-GMP phosphodiesterase class II)